MKCNSCGFENQAGNVVCSNCGKPLTPPQNNNVTNPNNLSNNGVNNVDLDKTVVLSNNSVLNSNAFNNTNSSTNSSNLNNSQNLNSNYNNVSSNTTSNMNNSNDNSKSNTSKNKRNLAIILAIILVVILAGLIYLGVKYLNPSSKKIFSNFTNNLYSSLKSATKTDYNSIYFDMELSANVSGTGSVDVEKIINKFNIKLNGGIDYQNKTFIYNFKTDYNNKELINIDAQYDKNLYLTFNNLYDKPIKFEENDLSEMFEKTNNEDVNVVVKAVIDAFNNSLDDSYFTSEKKEIEQDGKKIKTKVTTLNINKNNIEEISKKMMNDLKNNEEFIKSYAKVNEMEEADVKEALNSDNLDSSSFDSFTDDVNINLYTTGVTNKFVKIEFVSTDTTIEIVCKEDNQYVITVKNAETSLALNIKYNQEFDKKLELKDVSGAVSENELGDDFTTSLGNIVNNEGYIELNKDFEAATGYTIEDSILNLFGVGSIYDEAYENTYGYDENYYDEYDWNSDYSDENYDLDYDYNYDSSYDTYYDDYSTYESFNS